MVLYMVKTPPWPADAFRALLDRILDETDMSQVQLAALVPMDQSQLSRWKSGTSKPKYESLIALGKALQLRYPALGLGPDEVASVVYSGAADDTPTEPKPRISDAEKVAMAQVDAFRAALRAELEPLQELARQQEEAIQGLTRQHEEAITALKDEVRALRERKNDSNHPNHGKAG